MVKLIFDEQVLLPKATSLPPEIKTALWDFVERIVDNPDHPDLIGIIGVTGIERDGYRASQFTSGYVLDWQVTRRSSWMTTLSSGTPEEVKLWDVRGPFSAA